MSQATIIVHDQNTGSYAKKDASNIDDYLPEWRAKFAQSTEFIKLGKITTTTSPGNVHLAVHASGKNSFPSLTDQVYNVSNPQDFAFDEVPAGQLKSLILYGLPTAPYIFLAKGEAGIEAIDPNLPNGAVFLRQITASSEGAVIQQVNVDGLKTKAQDNWTEVLVSSAAPRAITAFGESAHFIIRKTSGFTAINLTGIIVKGTETWEGKSFHIFNDTDVDVNIDYSDIAPTSIPSGCFYNYYDEEGKYGALVIKPGNTGVLAFYNGALIPEKYGSDGGAKFPEAGNSGDILEKDDTTAEGAKWSNRLTTAENEIDAEVVNRAAEDLAEKNARIAGDNYLLDQLATESTNRANADLLKADNPSTDGTFSRKKVGNVFSWVAVQAGLDSSGLVDKMLSIWDASLLKLVAIPLKFVSGVINQLEFTGRFKTKSLILPANTDTFIANEFGTDGSRVFYADNLGVKRELRFIGLDKIGAANPPTLAELSALGVVKGDYYVRTVNGVESFRSMFDGAQLQDWTLSASEYSGITADQKAAVKIFNITL